MEKKTFTSTCNTAHGKPIGYYKDADGKPLKSFTYQFDSELYAETEQGRAELVAEKDELTLAEQVKVRNGEKVGKARAAQLSVELANRGVIKPTAENDSQILLKDIFDKLMLSKRYTVDAAREMAAQVSGIDWEDA